MVSVGPNQLSSQTDAKSYLSYAGPVILPNTLQVKTPTFSYNYVGHVTANWTLVRSQGLRAYFSCTNLVATPWAVVYGLPSSSIRFTCSDVQQQSFINNIYSISCALPDSIGSGLQFQVQAGKQQSLFGSDTLSHPAPVLVDSSLGDPDSPIRSNLLQVNTTEGQKITFKARHVGSRSDTLQVTYGPGPSYNQYSCKSVSVSVIDPNTEMAQITCRTVPGEGSNLRFIVTALNVASDPSSFAYSYPVAPVLYRIEGCPVQNGNASEGCSTEGGAVITVFGANFASDISTRISTSNCVLNAFFSSTKYTCQVSHGAGLGLQVVASSGLLFSRGVRLFSYAPPSITSVSGCTSDESHPGSIRNCARSGGDLITVVGNNFRDPVTVYIGGSQCTDVVHDNSQPHRRFICKTPPGAGMQRTLLVIQNGGTVGTSSNITISYSPCDPGQFVSGRYCLQCPPGTWSSTLNAAVCNLCNTGTISPSWGSSSCTSCSPGQHAYNSTTCTDCEVGRFSSATGVASCERCNLGTYSSTPGATQCLNCPAGTISSESLSSCIPCEAGSYSPTPKSVSCVQSPPGRYSVASGSNSSIDCPAGSYQDISGQTSCKLCPIGTSQSVQGQSICTDCSDGHFSNITGSISCQTCPYGTFSGSRASFCTNCPSGTYNDAMGAGSCTACIPGRFTSTTGNSICKACAAGSFSSLSASTSCSPCTPGYYAASAGLSSCSQCPSGSYSSVFQATNCTSCPSGQYSSGSATVSCSDCAKGTANPSIGQAQCPACPAGTYSNTTRATSCTKCSPGYSSSPSRDSCVACQPGTYSATAGNDQCLKCPAGSFADESTATSCQPCPVNSYSAPGQTTCSQCPDGTEAAQTGAVSCSNCPTGRYAQSGSSCSACPAGAYQSSEKQASCIQCPDGTMTTVAGSSVCAQCPAGRFNNASMSLKNQCWACPAGRKQTFKGQSFCTPCSAGSASPETGSSTCSSCVPGRFASSPGQSICEKCPAGTYSDIIKAQSCNNCSIGQASLNGAPGLSSCSDCIRGTYAPIEGTPSCMACPPGKYQSQSGLGVCQDCPVATFSSAYGSSHCTVCPPGTYTNITGQSSCALCPEGTFSLTGASTTCSLCPPGKHANTAGSTTCKSCDPGTYADISGLRDCKVCPQGTYTSQTDQKSCLTCPIGMFNTNAGQSSCTTCPLGRFSNTTGLQECFACPAGRSSNGPTQCSDCTPGTFAGEGYATCNNCPVGRSQPLSAQTECPLCPLGSEAPSERSRDCSPCANGRYAGSVGTVVCSQCPAGTFRDQHSPSGSECQGCPPGSAQALVGQTSCDLCTPGTFSPFYSSRNCIKCPAGRFANSTNTTQCAACPAGSFQDGQSLTPTTCTLCPPGTYSSTPESSSCIPCRAGTFSSSYGATSCSQCPVGYEQPNIGETNCAQCKPGWYADEEGTICKSCPSGQTSSGFGSVSCSDCPSGTFALGRNNSECTPCAPGSFSLRADIPLEACTRCPKGRYTDASGQKSCIDCEPGRYADEEGLTRCKSCSVGTHQKGNGSTSCNPCPGGYYQREEEQQVCIGCPAGRYSSDPVSGFGVAECSSCVPGTFSGPASRECSQCPARQVSTKPGQSECRACDVNSDSNAFNSECLCNIGYYNDEGDDPSSQCQVCTEGMRCRDTGLTISTLQADPGYWKPSNTSVNFYRCILQKNCEGGVSSVCQDNHHGPLCAICNPTYYGTLRGDCNVCPSKSDSLTYLLLVGSITLLVLWAQFFIVLRAGASKMHHVKAQDAVEKNEQFWSDVIGVGLTQSTSRHIIHESEQDRLKASQAEEAAIHGQPTPKPNFSYKLKIMLGFTQILTSLMTIVETPMPATFKEFVSIFTVMNLDLFSSSGLECIFNSTFYQKFLFASFSPLILLTLVIVLYLLPKTLFGRSIDSASRKRSRKKFWRMLVFSLFLIYPNVSSTIVRLFVCTKVEGVYYLRSDMRIQCYDETYQRYAGLGVFFALLYPIGIPCFFLFMLWRYRHRLQEDGVKAELGFLYDAFNHEIWWFELVDMIHKLALTGLVAFFPASYQLIAAATISVSYTILLLIVRPYVRKGDDRLHLFAQVEIFCAVLCGYIFKTDFTTNKSVDVGLSILLIITIGTFSAFFFVQAAAVIYKIIKLKKSRRKRNLENKLQVNAMKVSDGEEADIQDASPDKSATGLGFSQRSFYKLSNDNDM